MPSILLISFYLIQLSGRSICLQYNGLRNFAGREIQRDGDDYTIRTEAPYPESLQCFFTREIEIYDQIINNQKPLGSLEKLHFHARLREALQSQFKSLFDVLIPTFKGKSIQVIVTVTYNTSDNSCNLDYSIKQ